jgi:hypothetical protein
MPFDADGATVRVVGIDCAVDPRRVGLALGHWSAGRMEIRASAGGADPPGLVPRIVDWLAGARRALLALDAPLGWPTALGDSLAAHRAGARLAPPATALFRRASDTDVHVRSGQLPLEVGADRIARTAHAALALLDELRDATRRPLPLAWSPRWRGWAAIEVYPAATLRVHGLPHRAYKRADQVASRERILSGLARQADLACATEPLLASADRLDAGLCLLAAADFLAGTCPPPRDRVRARKEGWIWLRDTRY